MADNVRGASNDTALPNIATDDVGGVHYQRVKLDFGGDGASEPARTPNVFKNVAAVAVTAGTPVTVWTPAAGKKVRFMGYALSLSVAGSVILKTATVESIRTPLVLAGTGHTSSGMGNGILYAADAVFQVDATATGAVSGYVFGLEE